MDRILKLPEPVYTALRESARESGVTPADYDPHHSACVSALGGLPGDAPVTT